MFTKLFLLFSLFSTVVSVANYSESWGYADVREKAHIFWWLYAKPEDTTRPLVIWLQGGPGASSTGFGNFKEIGPQNIDGSPRETTWLNIADLIFIDNPVGTGFSYVDDNSAFTNNVDEIAADLLSWSKIFFTAHKQYRTRPLYIFCESYGGKMSAAFAYVLNRAIKAGEVKANLQGVALGDSWISPIDYVNTWTPYLYAFSLLGNSSQAALNVQAQKCQHFVTTKQWVQATNCWSTMESLVESNTDGADFYNVLQRSGTDFWNELTSHQEKQFAKHITFARSSDPLADLMNGYIKTKLKVIPANVTWGGQAGDVFNHQWKDFMKPIIKTVDLLLKEDDINVIVYNGQLDLICCTLGTERWMNRLQWPRIAEFHAKERTAMRLTNGQTGAFVKTLDKFTVFWVMRAGHMVPADAPEATNQLLKYVLGLKNE